MKKILGFLLLGTLAFSAPSMAVAEPELLNFLYSIRICEIVGDKEHFIASIPAIQAYTPKEPFARPHHSFTGRQFGYAKKLPDGSLAGKMLDVGTTMDIDSALSADKKISIKLTALHTKLLRDRRKDELGMPAVDTMQINRQMVLKDGETVRLESAKTEHGNQLVLYVKAALDIH